MAKQLVVFDTTTERLEGIDPQKADGIAVPAFSVSASRPPTGTLVGEAHYQPGNKHLSVWTQTGWMDAVPESLKLFPDLATMQLDTASANGTPAVITPTGEFFIKVPGGWRSSTLRRYADLAAANADTLAIDGSLGWIISEQTMVYREAGVWQRLIGTPRMNIGEAKPAAPIAGDMNFSPTSRRLEIWNGTVWEDALYYGATVGDVKHSLLTEAQFKTAIGTIEAPKWMLCDGRSCAGTTFATITGKNTVPDLRGSFLRGAGQNNNAAWTGPSLNDYQEDSTRMPRSPFTATTNSAGAHTHTATIPAGASWMQGGQPNYIGYRDNYGVRNFTAGTDSQGNHTHTVTVAGGDAETRPKNYGVNFFIRVSA